MRPSAAIAQAIMTFQAFIDDSRSSGEDGLFVLGGCIGSAEEWVKFSLDWQELLPLAPLDDNLERHFKFSEILRAGDERIQHLPSFGKAISSHALCNIIFILRTADIVAAQNRIHAPGFNLEWGDYRNPYLFAFVSFIEVFHNQREAFAPILNPDDSVDFIFDDQSEKRTIQSAWDGFLKAQAPDSAVERFSSEPPRFLSDKKFLPLQAADFVAGWSRYCLERGLSPAKAKVNIGSHEISNPFMPLIVCEMTQDQMVKFLLAMVQRNLPPGRFAYDLRLIPPSPPSPPSVSSGTQFS